MLHGLCYLKKDMVIAGVQFKAEDNRIGDLTAFLPGEAFAVMMWTSEEQKSQLTARFAWVTFHSFMDFHEYFKITDCTDQVSQQYNKLLSQNGFPTIDWIDDKDIVEGGV